MSLGFTVTMAKTYILATMVICVGITIVYGENCDISIDYKKQIKEEVFYLRTTEIIHNFPVSPEFNSNQSSTMYCAVICMEHGATVCARHGQTCFAHNYTTSGGFHMRMMHEVMIKKGLMFVKGKQHSIEFTLNLSL